MPNGTFVSSNDISEKLTKTCNIQNQSAQPSLLENKLTIPPILMQTAASFDKVNLSPELEGKRAANTKVKRLELDDMTVTIPVSVSAKATWNA